MKIVLAVVLLCTSTIASAGFVSGAVGGAVAGAIVSSGNTQAKLVTSTQPSRKVVSGRTILVCALDNGGCYDFQGFDKSKDPLKYAGSLGFKFVHSQELVKCDTGYSRYCLLLEVSK